MIFLQVLKGGVQTQQDVPEDGECHLYGVPLRAFGGF